MQFEAKPKPARHNRGNLQRSRRPSGTMDYSRSLRQSRKLHTGSGFARTSRQALKCTIRQAQEVDRANSFQYNGQEGTFDKTHILGGES